MVGFTGRHFLPFLNCLPKKQRFELLNILNFKENVPLFVRYDKIPSKMVKLYENMWFIFVYLTFYETANGPVGLAPEAINFYTLQRLT